MPTIPAAVGQVLQARNDATRQQIDTALLRKNLDAQKHQGEAINALLEQTVEIQRQISSGRLDVKA